MTTHTFLDKDGIVQLTVKKEFLDKCPNPHEQDLESLTVNFEFKTFLHNPVGPAVVYQAKLPAEALEALNKNDAIKNNESYWLDGVQLSGEEREKFLHDMKFNSSMENILEEYKAEKKA